MTEHETVMHYLIQGRWPHVWCGAATMSLTLIPALVTCQDCLARNEARAS